jgi:hypothetical protein
MPGAPKRSAISPKSRARDRGAIDADLVRTTVARRGSDILNGANAPPPTVRGGWNYLLGGGWPARRRTSSTVVDRQ